MNRPRLLLIVLVGLLALAVLYAYWTAPRQRRVAERDWQASAAASGRSAVARAPSASEKNRIHLELLAREKEAFPGFKRDIFRFYQPPPKPLPPPPPVAIAPPPPPVLEEPPMTFEVQRELARFTFLGFLRKDGQKTIFLSSGDDIFVVKKGDRFGKEKSFVITDLTPEKLTIRQDDDPRPIVISLVEQAPLAVLPGGPSAREGVFSSPPQFRRGYLPPPRGGALPMPTEPADEEEELENDEQPVAEDAPPDAVPKEAPHD